MRIFEAVVTSNRDDTKSGRFNAKLEGEDLSIEGVIYTTPYHSPYFQGQFSPPSLHSKVLLCHDEIKNKYYYMSTVVEHTVDHGAVPINKMGQPLPLVMEPNLYNDAYRPQKMTFKNGQGAGLSITSFHGKDAAGTQKPIVSETKLESEGGNMVVVSNSPDAQGIIIQNKHRDGIVISSSSYKGYAARTITTESESTQSCIVKHGDYKVSIVDGRDMTFKNNSLGTYGMLPAPIPPTLPYPRQAVPPYIPNPLLQFGNVNLVSKYRDINIYTDNPFFTAPGNSNIYVSTDRGMIQLKANGDIMIYANTGAVNIQGASGLNLTSLLGDININSAGNINMKALLNINSFAGVSMNNSSNTDINIHAANNFNAAGTNETNIGISTTTYTLIPNTNPTQYAPTSQDAIGAVSPFGKTYINPGFNSAINATIVNVSTPIQQPKTVLEQGFNVYGK
jgi:hypothetical protein